MKDFYSPEELAEFFAISRATVYRLVNQRKLPFHKVGGVLRFRKAEIEAFLASSRIEPMRF